MDKKSCFVCAVVTAAVACLSVAGLVACIYNEKQAYNAIEQYKDSVKVLNNKIDDYHDYYIKSELLFNQVEEENEATFDTDRGCEYLDARKVLLDKYNEKELTKEDSTCVRINN